MKKILALLLVVAMCVSFSSCMPNLKRYSVQFADEKIDVSLADMRNEEYIAFLEKLEAFSSKLTASVYGNLSKNQNFCISPVSVYMALAIACEGSDGETRQQILDAVGVTYDEVAAFTKYLYAFRNREFEYENTFGSKQVSAYEQLSNSIWLDDSVVYRSDCVNTLASQYNCDVYSASFKSNTASKMINQYIEYKTHGLIKGEAQFSDDTAFAIINTFYLKEIWNDLGKSLTLTLEYYDFLNSDKNTVKTQLLKGYYSQGRVYEEEKFSSFYTQTEHGYRIHFIVPADNANLGDIFNEETINKILSLDDYGYVDDENRQLHNTRVFFPEFDASFSGNIAGILEESFNITDLFDKEKCDMSALIASPVYCNNVIHKCRLNVTEKGIEGAAVTVVPGATSPAPPEYEDVYHDFIVNKCFGFVLTDAYGTVLFSGAINSLD